MRRIQPGPWAVVSGLLLTATAAARPADPPQTPQFRILTDLVRTEVIVRDSRGVFVPGLGPSDFEIYEDGVRQTVSTFVAIVGGRAVPAVVPPPVTGEGLVLPPVKQPDPGRVFIVFIDDRHIQPGDSILARRVLNQIRDVLLHPGDLFAMVSTGPSSIEVPLSYVSDHARFNSAVARVLADGMTPDQIISANQTSQGPAGLRHNAHVAFRTAYDMIAELGKIPDRRKAFLYVTSGYDFNPFVNERYKAIQDMYASPQDSSGLSREDLNRFRNPFESGGQQFSEMDLIAELAALTRAAVRANVTFYPIDPRGLVAGPPINSALSLVGYRAHVETSVSSMRILADETGGRCICETNDFARGLREIDNATSDYYVLGYAPCNPDPQKIRRRIEVRVAKPGLTVTGYRREYTIKRW